MQAMTVLSGAAKLGTKGGAKAPSQNPWSWSPKIRPRTLELKLGNVEPEFVDDDCAVVAHLFHTGRDPGLIQRSALRIQPWLGPAARRGPWRALFPRPIRARGCVPRPVTLPARPPPAPVRSGLPSRQG